MDVNDQRRNRRFELRLPLELVRAGSNAMNQAAETMNMSSGGVLFTTDQNLEIGLPIEYFITLPASGDDGVRLRCVGKVVRREIPSESAADDPSFIAATLERYEFVRPASE